MRGRIGWLVVSAAVVGLALWRLAYVLGGVDPDSDAYGHHAIARQILDNPRDLTVHWVWLPLWHYTQAIGIFFGAQLQTFRLINVALSAAVPLVLYGLLRAHRETSPDPRWDPAPELAAIIATLSPIAMQMGTTGQTEPIFALLIISFVYALARGKNVVAAALLAMAVLIRYEAWSVLGAVVALMLLPRVFKRARPIDRLVIDPARRKRVALLLIAPIVVIGIWTVMRRPADGAWFWFLKQTKAFANDATGVQSSMQLGLKRLGQDLIFYAVDVPWRVVGYPLLLAPFGIVRTVKREGARFCVVYLAILGFVTLTWVMRSSLGLDRHFVVLIPFYGTLIANGVVAIGAFLDETIAARMKGAIHAFAASGAVRAAVIAGLGCAIIGNTSTILETWMRDWRHASEEVWPDRRAVAAHIRSLPADARIFCDEPTVELLSEVDRRRFDRRSLDDKRALKWIGEASRYYPATYVVTWAVKVKRLGLRGEIVYRPPASENKDDVGLVVMRIPRG